MELSMWFLVGLAGLVFFGILEFLALPFKAWGILVIPLKVVEESIDMAMDGTPPGRHKILKFVVLVGGAFLLFLGTCVYVFVMTLLTANNRRTQHMLAL